MKLRMLASFVVTVSVLTPTFAQTLSDSEFTSIFKQLDFKSQPWATIPWKVSVSEARAFAAKSGKPMFMVVNTGNCLGFV